MLNKEKYDLNTLKIEWSPQVFEKRLFTIKLKSDERTIFSKEMTPMETGTSAYSAWLEEDYEPTILTEKEKAYLSSVIKPFRKRIEYIEKRCFVSGTEYILISLQNNKTLSFPTFKTGTMYKGMKSRKEYTLEELGL